MAAKREEGSDFSESWGSDAPGAGATGWAPHKPRPEAAVGVGGAPPAASLPPPLRTWLSTRCIAALPPYCSAAAEGSGVGSGNQGDLIVKIIRITHLLGDGVTVVRPHLNNDRKTTGGTCVVSAAQPMYTRRRRDDHPVTSVHRPSSSCKLAGGNSHPKALSW